MNVNMIKQMIAWANGGKSRDLDELISLYQQLINLGLMDKPEDPYYTTAAWLIHMGYCHRRES